MGANISLHIAERPPPKVNIMSFNFKIYMYVMLLLLLKTFVQKRTKTI